MKSLVVLATVAAASGAHAATISSSVDVGSGQCYSASLSDGPGELDDYGSFADICAVSGYFGNPEQPNNQGSVNGGASARAHAGEPSLPWQGVEVLRGIASAQAVPPAHGIVPSQAGC